MMNSNVQASISSLGVSARPGDVEKLDAEKGE
jgi:hypothetical protein